MKEWKYIISRARSDPSSLRSIRMTKVDAINSLRKIFMKLRIMYPRLLAAFILFVSSPWSVNAQQQDQTPALLVDVFKHVDRSTDWVLVSEIDIAFDTYHPQGFALVDDHLFISSVEVHERTRRFTEPQGRFDRTAGAGIGHIFKVDMQGTLKAHVEIGEGAIYHPGGIDYDGATLWIPVAEYRPNSRSIIYSMDPDSLIPRERFRIEDHIGGIVANTTDQALHAVSWGSRRYYSWELENTPVDLGATVQSTLNPAHYIDYQDCQYTGGQTAICSGLATYYQESQTRFALGGLELIDLKSGHPLHQVPFTHWTENGLSMMQNPVVLELDNTIIRLYAMPEDNQSRLFIYEANFGRSD